MTEYPQRNGADNLARGGRGWGAGLHNLARVRQAMGRFAEAEMLLQQAQAIVERAHPLYGVTLNELAVVRQALGRHVEAETLFEQVLAIYEQALSVAHPNYARALLNLARLHAATARIDEARAELQQSLAIMREKLGGDHSWTQETQTELDALEKQNWQ